MIRGITNTIGSRVKGGNNTIVTVANSNGLIHIKEVVEEDLALDNFFKSEKNWEIACAFSQKIFIQKVIGPIGFGFPHAIKRQK